MPEIILGILVLVFLLWASNAFASIDPRKLAPVVRYGSGIGALGGAAFLAARGQFPLAVPLGFAGLGLLGWLPAAFRVSARAPKRRPDRRRRYVPDSWRWSSITIPGRCAGAFSPAGIGASRSMPSMS